MRAYFHRPAHALTSSWRRPRGHRKPRFWQVALGIVTVAQLLQQHAQAV